MVETGEPARSRNEWEREVEEICSRLRSAVAALEAALSCEASCRRLAAQMLSGPAYFDDPTPEVIAKFARQAKEREAMADTAAKEATGRRVEIGMLIGQARRLAGEMEGAVHTGERQLEGLRRRNFGRYNDDVRSASAAWAAESSFFGDLLSRLEGCLRSVAERVAVVEKQHAQARQNPGAAPAGTRSEPRPGASSPPMGAATGSGARGNGPTGPGAAPTLPPFRW